MAYLKHDTAKRVHVAVGTDSWNVAILIDTVDLRGCPPDCSTDGGGKIRSALKFGKYGRQAKVTETRFALYVDEDI